MRRRRAARNRDGGTFIIPGEESHGSWRQMQGHLLLLLTRRLDAITVSRRVRDYEDIKWKPVATARPKKQKTGGEVEI